MITWRTKERTLLIDPLTKQDNQKQQASRHSFCFHLFPAWCEMGDHTIQRPRSKQELTDHRCYFLCQPIKMSIPPNPLPCRYGILIGRSLQIQHSSSFAKDVRPRFKILSSEMLPTTLASESPATESVNKSGVSKSWAKTVSSSPMAC